MQNTKKYTKPFKYFSLTVFCTSAGWIYYQIYKTRNVLNNALDTSVLNLMENSSSGEEKSSQEFLNLQVLKTHTRNNTLIRAWDSFKFAYARRLLSLAASDNIVLREKAIKKLGNIKNLDDWHCSLLANMMDARTAVGLARTKGVDQRFFAQPPPRYLNYNKQMLVNEMKELLVGLYERSNHGCMEYFISNVFVDEQDVSRVVDHETSTMELSKFVHSANDVIPMCLESLLHHASIEEYVKDIVELNGLSLLMEIHNRFRHNIAVTVVLCRIISYLSFRTDLVEPMYKSGWVTVLAKWINHEDIRISIPAARALSNLDQDEDAIFSKRLFLLHPLARNYKPPAVDVIFVHGLLGGVFFTWRQRNKRQTTLGILEKFQNVVNQMWFKTDTTQSQDPPKITKTSDPNTKQYLENFSEIVGDTSVCSSYDVVLNDLPTKTNPECTGPYTCPGSVYDESKCCYTFCWPKDWLPVDCQDTRVIGINYDTSLSMWAPICASEKVKPTLEERSNELLTKLLVAGVGSRPIVWVTHSMGGLIVKNILCKAFESDDWRLRDICYNTKGLIFYSTPHIGSRLANLSQATALLLWPSVEVQELRENSPKLKELHDKFLKMTKQVSMKIVTFVETKSTIVTALKFNFLFVEPHSGNPGVGEYYEIPQDHLDICKPLNRYSFLYQKVLKVIKEVLAENT